MDRAIETCFSDGRYIVRAIGMDEHPELTRQEMARIIVTTGWDKYDTSRRAIGHEEFSGYDYDIQAGPIEIRNSRLVRTAEDRIPTIFGGIAWHFYHGAPLDRGYPVRIDFLMLYDPTKLARARKRFPGAKSVRRGLSRNLYKFREPSHRRTALRGLVEILR